MEPIGRNNNPHLQNLRRSALLHHLTVESSSVLVNIILTYVPALTVLCTISCTPDNTTANDKFGVEEVCGKQGGETDPNEADSINTRLSFYIDSKIACGINKLDCFIYDTENTKTLERHICMTMAGNEFVGKNQWSAMEVRTASESPRAVVAIANCPKAFNLEALRSKDSIDILEYEFENETADSPLLSGESIFRPGTSTTVALKPLVSQIRIKSITNGIRNYELIEDPSVRLCAINRSARILQRKDFNPIELIDKGQLHKLPTDIGFYTQHPDISLYCYPYDSYESSLGTPCSSLEFNCRIKGREYSFPFDLPSIERGSLIDVDLTIDGFDFQQQKAIFTK